MRRPSRAAGSAKPPRALTELGLLAGLYGGYSLTRALAEVQPHAARANGQLILDLEAAVGLDIEAAAVGWLVGSKALSVIAGYLYAAPHYVVTPLVLVWLYARRQDRYRSARTALVAATLTALVCYWLMPTAPPRLLSSAYPDILALTSGYGWWGAEASAPRGLGSLTNQYAAMPSMHVGWALWCGIAVATAVRGRLARTIAVLYPLLVVGVVVVTANHYVLDAVAGGAVVLAAVLASRQRGLRPAASDGRAGQLAGAPATPDLRLAHVDGTGARWRPVRDTASQCDSGVLPAVEGVPGRRSAAPRVAFLSALRRPRARGQAPLSEPAGRLVRPGGVTGTRRKGARSRPSTGVVTPAGRTAGRTAGGVLTNGPTVRSAASDEKQGLRGPAPRRSALPRQERSRVQRTSRRPLVAWHRGGSASSRHPARAYEAKARPLSS